jgi:hypothetical protein
MDKAIPLRPNRPLLYPAGNSLYVPHQICTALLQLPAIRLPQDNAKLRKSARQYASRAANFYALSKEDSRMVAGTVGFFSTQPGFGCIQPEGQAL